MVGNNLIVYVSNRKIPAKTKQLKTFILCIAGHSLGLIYNTGEPLLHRLDILLCIVVDNFYHNSTKPIDSSQNLIAKKNQSRTDST